MSDHTKTAEAIKQSISAKAEQNKNLPQSVKLGFFDAAVNAFKNPALNDLVQSNGFMGARMADAYMNTVTGAGTAIDKQMANRWVNRPFLGPDEMNAMYVGSWICRKLVDIPVDDALSEGIEFTHLSSKDNILMRDRLTQLHFFERMRELGRLGRMSGIGMGLIGIRDGVDSGKLGTTLDINSIQKNSLTGITVVDRTYVGTVAENVANPTQPNFLIPDKYIVFGATISSSRVLRFDGDYLPPNMLQQNGYWHASVFERVRELLGRYESIENAVSLLPSEMLLKVYKAADTAAWMAGNDNDATSSLQGKMEAVIQTMTTLQSVYRTVILPSDQEGGFERQDLSVSGIAEILMNYASLVSAAADIPHTRFLGESPAGMSSTGDGQFQDYNKMIRSIQESKYRPSFAYYFNIVARDIWGDEAGDKNLSFDFNSIYSETDEQRVARETTQLTMLRDAVDAGFLMPAQAIAQAKAWGLFPVITDKYIEWVNAVDKVEEAKENYGLWPNYGMFDDDDPGKQYLPPSIQQPGEEKGDQESLANWVNSRISGAGR